MIFVIDKSQDTVLLEPGDQVEAQRGGRIVHAHSACGWQSWSEAAASWVLPMPLFPHLPRLLLEELFAWSSRVLP